MMFAPCFLLAVKVTVIVSLRVGLPEIIPVSEFRLSPAGSLLEVYDVAAKLVVRV